MKYQAVVAYQGTDFFGFERQVDKRTVQGVLENVLSQYLGIETKLKAAGRTDAGVHALGQVIAFDSPRPLSLASALYALNRLLPPDIVLKSMQKVPVSFDPRHSSHSKTYRYLLNIGPREPLVHSFEWQLSRPDFHDDKFRKALSLYGGTHCFRMFTVKKEDKDGFIRTLEPVGVTLKGDHYELTFTGNGFMTYMVRFLVGAAVEAALGNVTIAEIKKALSSNSGTPLAHKAPPEGLYLVDVDYGD